MSLRFRRSMKLLPGVRLNFSKETVGLSFGVPGARYTVNSKGRQTVSTGIPGTGLYNVETISSGSRRSGRSSSEETWEATDPNREPPAPGLFARKAERELNTFLHDIYDAADSDDPSSVIEKAAALRAKYEELRYPLELISFLHGITDDEWEAKAAEWGAGLCLVDIGGGTTDIAVFKQGAIRHTAVIPIAGDQITNDVAVALRTPTQSAEDIKINHGCALRQLAIICLQNQT